MDRMIKTDALISKTLQWGSSIGGGLLVAVETAVPFFLPCLLLTLIDVVSAWDLGRRLHKKYPAKVDGKFKSEYKKRILLTMIIVFLALILGSYADQLVLRDMGQDYGVRFVMGVIFFYQIWSILENWSSERESNKVARGLQRWMINKAERHLNVTLTDIFEMDKKDMNQQND